MCLENNRVNARFLGEWVVVGISNFMYVNGKWSDIQHLVHNQLPPLCDVELVTRLSNSHVTGAIQMALI